MKKKSIIIISLAILIGASIYYAFFNKPKNQIDETSIQLGDTTDLTEVIFRKDTASLHLVKKGSNWMVNNTFHANKQLIKRTLRIFKNINIKTIVKRDSVISHASYLKSYGTYIEFVGKNKTIANYWVSDFFEKNKACLIMNEEEIPIYVNAPGFTSDISEYISTNPLFWRDKRLFDFEPNELISIKLTDINNQTNSFQITSNQEKFDLMNSQNVIEEYSLEKIERYLSYFKNISFDSIANENVFAIDTLLKNKALYEMQINFINDGQLNLKLIEKPDPKNNNEANLNHVYGLLNNTPPVVVISYFSIDPLLKSIDYFKTEN